MARIPKSPKDASAARLGFEAQMWHAADKLRTNEDATKYTHVVLGLILLNYLPDTFGDQSTQRKASYGHVLTPGCSVGADDVENGGEPFDAQTMRLDADLSGQFEDSAELEFAVPAHFNLRDLFS